jgi:hypothetical protein
MLLSLCDNYSGPVPYLLPNHELRVLNIEKSHDFMKYQGNKNDLRVEFSKQDFHSHWTGRITSHGFSKIADSDS